MLKPLQMICSVSLLGGLAGAAAPTAAPIAQSTNFVMPSGHMGCAYMDADPSYGTPANIRCDVYYPTFKRVPQPKDCPLAYGDSLELTATGKPTWVCHGDTVVDTRNPVLAYGETWKYSDFTCTSSMAGIRCTNKAKHGFELAQGKYRLF